MSGQGSTAIKRFFLACVLVAGLFGALTASRKTLFVQALPAAIGLFSSVLPEPPLIPVLHQRRQAAIPLFTRMRAVIVRGFPEPVVIFAQRFQYR